MPAPDSFQTDRLIATRLQAGDSPDWFRLYRDPRVVATLGGQRADEEIQRLLQFNLDHWDRHGFGVWVVRDAATGQFAGRGGIRHIDIEGQPEIEVSYALMPEFWGRGLATEMARAFLGIGFGSLARPELVCFTLPMNLASKRVMEKVGFQYERNIIFAGLPHIFYRLRRPDRITSFSSPAAAPSRSSPTNPAASPPG